MDRENEILIEVMKGLRERETGTGKKQISYGNGKREREEIIFLRERETGTGTKIFFRGNGNGKREPKKSFPQDSTFKWGSAR